VPVLFLRVTPGLETQGPFCLWRTKRGLRLLDKLARHRRFWSGLADAGIIFAFGLLGAGYLAVKARPSRAEALRLVAKYAVVTAVSLVITLYVMFFGNSNMMGMLLGGQIMLSPMLFITIMLGGLGIFILVSVISNTFYIIWQYLAGFAPLPGIAPLLPGVSVPGSPLMVPFHAIIALAVLVAVHEFGHGIVSRMEKIKVKSLGILTSGLIPVGAFAEPDDRQLKRGSMLSRLRVFSVGSMMNFVTGFAFLAVFIAAQALVQPQFVQDPSVMTPSLIPWGSNYVDGLVVTGVYADSPAADAGLAAGTVIRNYDVAFSAKTPYKVVPLETTTKGTIYLQRDGEGYLGFNYAVIGKNYGLGILLAKYSLEILLWIFLLNFLVGVINLLPFAIFDGARIFEDIVAFYAKGLGLGGERIAKRVTAGVTALILVLLLVNALPYFIAKF
jgi:Zn-dependent protease